MQNTKHRNDRQMLHARTHEHTHTHIALCEHNDVTVLWTHGVETENLRQMGET